MEENKKSKFDIKASLHTKNVKFGAYSSALTAIVVAVAVAVNLLFSNVLSDKITFDMSPDDLYSIGSQTKEFLKDLDEDVAITVLADKDNSDSTINQLLDMYKGASGHIKVDYVDPNVDINAANAYSGLGSNSLVVSCGSKETTIDINSIYVSDYSSYYTTGEVQTSFDGEGQITSAIDYVTSDNLPMLYNITGHGEIAVSAKVSSLISKENIQMSDLNLMTSGGIPEDCDSLLINAPSKDYTAEEAKIVIDYLNNGGSAMVLSYYTENDMTNFESILNAYGINISEGIVMESSSNYYQYPMYIIPDIESTELTGELADERANILIFNAQGLTANEESEAQTTKLLSSSGGAYSKPITGGRLETYEKEAGDIDGPFAYAYLSEKSSDDKEGRMIVVSSVTLIDDGITQNTSLGNLDFYMNCLSYLTGGGEADSSISIDAKNINAEYMTVPAMHAMTFMFVTIILIPAVILIIGLVIWVKRRKR
ncbi:MAG: hypothetical protein HFE90_04200 [Firmicutes bacterium]|nr:hypothetical protein [Bacillota bacterium]